MKTALVNLLILCSLILCGFVAFQWMREARLRSDLQALTLDAHKKSEVIANLENTIKTLQNEITRLDGLKQELAGSGKTNEQAIAQMRIELRRFAGENESLTNQLQSHKEALSKANASIQKQNADIKKQNVAIDEMAKQRNSAIAKQNEVIAQYNDLVKRFNEAQEMLKANSAKTTN